MRAFKRERLEPGYNYVESLSQEAIAWEYLRREPRYIADANAEAPSSAQHIQPEIPRPEVSPSLPDIGQRWGLRFCREPG